MEQKIAEHLTILLQRKGISKDYLKDNGIHQDLYQRILQSGQGKGKTYTVKSLAKFLKVIGEDEIKIFGFGIELG